MIKHRLGLILILLLISLGSKAENGFFNFLTYLNNAQINHQEDGKTILGNIEYSYKKDFDLKGDLLGYQFQCYDQDFKIGFLGSMMSVHRLGTNEGLFVDIASSRYKSIENYLSDQLWIDAVEPTTEPHRGTRNTFHVSLEGTNPRLDKVNLFSPKKNIGFTPIAVDDTGKMHTLLKERSFLASMKVFSNYIPFVSWLLTQSLNQKGEDRQISIGRAMYWMDLIMNSHEELKNLNMNLLDVNASEEQRSRASYFFANILTQSGLYNKSLEETKNALEKSAMNYPQLAFLNRKINKEKFYSEVKRHFDETEIKGNSWKPEEMFDYFKGSEFETFRSRLANYSIFVVWFLSKEISPVLRNFTDINDYRTRGIQLGYLLEHYYNEKEEKKYNFMKQAVYLGKFRIANYEVMRDRVSKVMRTIPSLICASYERVIFGENLSAKVLEAQKAINKGVDPLESSDFLMFKDRDAIEHIIQGHHYIDQGNYRKALKKFKHAHIELGKSAKKILDAEGILVNIEDEEELYIFNLNRERQKLVDLIREWKSLALKLNLGVEKILSQQQTGEIEEGYFLYSLHYSKSDKKDKYYHDFMELYNHPLSLN